MKLPKTVHEGLTRDFKIVEPGITGDAVANYNPLSGSWHVSGQKDNPVPYICDSIKYASNLMQTINHFNNTGDKLAFRNSDKYFKEVL